MQFNRIPCLPHLKMSVTQEMGMEIVKVINKLYNKLTNKENRLIKPFQMKHFKCKKNKYRESHLFIHENKKTRFVKK